MHSPLRYTKTMNDLVMQRMTLVSHLGWLQHTPIDGLDSYQTLSKPPVSYMAVLSFSLNVSSSAYSGTSSSLKQVCATGSALLRISARTVISMAPTAATGRLGEPCRYHRATNQSAIPITAQKSPCFQSL